VNFDPLSPPQSAEPPAERLAIMRTLVLDEVAKRERQENQRWPWLPFVAAAPRRLGLIAAAIALAGGVGTAAAVGFDFLAEQERVDQQQWSPPEFTAAGPRVEVRRGGDWSFMAWRSETGMCVAYASGGVSNWGRSCGRKPVRSDDHRYPSDYLIATLVVPSSASDGRGAVVGFVTAEVARLELEFADGRTLSAITEPAPASFDTDARLFIVRAAIKSRASSLTERPWLPIRAYTSYSGEGRRLETYLTG
jgi:hypothetical protein